MRSAIRCLGLGVLFVALGFALTVSGPSPADAADFAISGCATTPGGGSTPVPTGRCWAYDIPVLPFLPLFSAPGAMGSAMQTGTGPADLTLPAGAFSNPQNPVIIPMIPLKGLPFLQFATSFYVASAPTAGTGPANFFDGPKTSRPANFSWCPGDPACTTPAGETLPGRVRYVAGANQFGGTMNSLWLGGGAVSSLTGGGGIKHEPLAGTLVNGKPYASYMSGVGPAAKTTVGGVYTPDGAITQPGTTINTGAGFTNKIWGFPFTTGMVIIDGLPAPSTTISQTGLDGRTSMGLGNISMVSGAIGNSSISGAHAELLTISMNLVSPKGAPSIGRVGFATLALLLVGVVFVAFRRR